MLFICATTFVLQHVNYGKFSDDQRKYASYLNYEAEEYREGICFLTSRYNSFDFYDRDTCVAHEEGKKNHLLLGDSHAAHWFYAIDDIRPSSVTITQVTSSGCHPTIPFVGSERCTDLMNWAFEELLPTKYFDKIILSSRWKYHSASLLKNTIEKLRLYTDNIVVLGPTVEYDSQLPRILAFNQDESSISKHRLYDKIKHIDNKMREETLNIKNVRYVSILDLSLIHI